MKKIFMIFAAMLVGMVALQSCRPSDSAAFLFDMNITGEAQGDVIVTAPNLFLEIGGDANIGFSYTNDTTLVDLVNALSQEQALLSNSEDVVAFAKTLDEKFTVSLDTTQAGGHAKVAIDGYAKEPTTGLTIRVNKVFEWPKPAVDSL